VLSEGVDEFCGRYTQPDLKDSSGLESSPSALAAVERSYEGCSNNKITWSERVSDNVEGDSPDRVVQTSTKWGLFSRSKHRSPQDIVSRGFLLASGSE
jgi:hypothetical protein